MKPTPESVALYPAASVAAAYQTVRHACKATPYGRPYTINFKELLGSTKMTEEYVQYLRGEVATALLNGQWQRDVVKRLVNEENISEDDAEILVRSVNEAINDIRRQEIRKQWYIILGVAVAMYFICWKISLLPGMTNQIGDAVGKVLGLVISALAKGLGYSGIALGALIGWAAYIIHFLATQ